MEGDLGKVLRTAVEQKWCTGPACTTCGAMDFRTAIGGIGSASLARDLSASPEELLTGLQDLDGAVQLIFRRLDSADKRAVLEAWASRESHFERLDDVVLFRFIRGMAPNDAIREAWCQRGSRLATLTRDASLVETTLLVLGSGAAADTALCQLARELAPGSPRVQRALKRCS